MDGDRTDARPRCATCGRVSGEDLRRGYCPVTANWMHPGMLAERCAFYMPLKDGDRRRRPDVRQE